MNLVFQHEIISDDLDDDKSRYIAANNNNCNLKGMLTCRTKLIMVNCKRQSDSMSV